MFYVHHEFCAEHGCGQAGLGCFDYCSKLFALDEFACQAEGEDSVDSGQDHLGVVAVFLGQEVEDVVKFAVLIPDEGFGGISLGCRLCLIVGYISKAHI